MKREPFVHAVSIGARCPAATVLRTMNLRKFSTPFDYMISTLDVIADCIEDSFVKFTDWEKYTLSYRPYFSIKRGEKLYLADWHHHVHCNTHYDDLADETFYNSGCALPHHDVASEADRQKILRSVDRFIKCVSDTKPTFLLHIARHNGDVDKMIKNAKKLETVLSGKPGPFHILLVSAGDGTSRESSIQYSSVISENIDHIHLRLSTTARDDGAFFNDSVNEMNLITGYISKNYKFV